MPAEAEWTIQYDAADPTSGLVRVSEGHACRARGTGMDYQT